MSVRYLSRGTTRSLYWSEPQKHGNGQPVRDDRGNPTYEHHLLMPLVTLFLGAYEEDQLCVKGNYWAEVTGEDGSKQVVPFDLDRNWASITAEQVCYLYETAKDLDLAELEAAIAEGAPAQRPWSRRRVRLVWVEDVQPSQQGRVYVCAQAFLLELGDAPAAVELGLDLQRRLTYPPDHQETGEFFEHRGEIVITGAALALAMSRQLLQYAGTHDRLPAEEGPVMPSTHPNTYLAELPAYIQHMGDLPAALTPAEDPVQAAARARFAKGAVNRQPEPEAEPDIFS